jgi:hypothetical protein
MITAILSAQDQISKIYPLNENAENRILTLTGLLQATESYGCHMAEQVLSTKITVLGAVNPPKSLGFYNSCPTFNPPGPGTNLAVDLGSPLTFSPEGTSIVGAVTGWLPNSIPSEALVASIQYIRVSKLGIFIDSKPICKSQIGGLSSSCALSCFENNTYTVSGVKIEVQTPSTSPNFVTIYDNQSLNFTLGSSSYSSSAVTSWTDVHLRNGNAWHNFMMDTNCSKSK